jgi:hypothetical protein
MPDALKFWPPEGKEENGEQTESVGTLAQVAAGGRHGCPFSVLKPQMNIAVQ